MFIDATSSAPASGGGGQVAGDELLALDTA